MRFRNPGLGKAKPYHISWNLERYFRTMDEGIPWYECPGNSSMLCNTEVDLDNCFLFYFIICGVLGNIICATGLLGNLLSLIILNKVGKKSVSFFLLKSLAIVDSIYLTAYVFNWNVKSVFNFFGREDLTYSVYQYFWKDVVYPVYCACTTASSWNVCLLTFHRLYCLVVFESVIFFKKNNEINAGPLP